MSDCWQCKSPLSEPSLFCPTCEALQPPDPHRNHFDVLGLTARYAVDKAQMEQAFKKLSRQLHPDRFAMEGPTARRLSMEHATALNDAYRTLRDDGRRARYLLELWGRPIDEKSGRTASLPFEFLEEVMELRESLSEARHSDGGDAAIAEGLSAVRARKEALQAQLTELFAAHFAATNAQRGALEADIEQVVHRQKYLQSILNEYGGGR